MPATQVDTGQRQTGDKIAFWEILPDRDAECPLEWGTQGIIYHRKSDLRRDIENLNYVSGERLTEILEENENAVPLDYYEHGQSVWFPQGSKRLPDMRWDGVRLAGVWAPNESWKPEDPYEAAEIVCEEFSNWANGHVVGYVVRVYEYSGADFESAYGEPIDRDSCFGFYTIEHCREEIGRVIEHMS